MRAPAIAVPIIVLVLSGCGGSPAHGTDSDGAVDSAVEATTDGSIDGAPMEDGDGDGVDAAVDCDDTDPDVGRSSTVDCETPCGTGTIECSDGVTSECDAPTDCVCSAGETRVMSCPLCGMQPQRCGADGVFEDDGECLYQGACEPGTVEDDTSYCGHRRRLCGEDCEWLEWEVLVRPRDCNPGQVRTCPNGERLTCNDYCIWSGLCD